MRKFYLLICIIFLFASACSDKNKIPEGVLPAEKMQFVMWDMLQAGQFLNDFVFNKDTSIGKVSESLKWYDKIYQVHGITKEQFIKSFRYYKDHPALMKRILDSLGKNTIRDNDLTNTENSISPLPGNLSSKNESAKRRDSAKLLMVDSIKRIKRLDKMEIR